MQYALINKKRSEAIKNAKGECPSCRGIVVAKCGWINAHHWAHKSDVGCSDWHEPETKWHRDWKNLFDEKYRERIIEKEGKKHIADIQLNNGKVIEFQHSSISVSDIMERVLFYRNLLWVIDGVSFKDNFYIYDKGEYQTFRWKHGRRSWFLPIRYSDVCIDFGEKVFWIKKIYTEEKVAGWGKTIDKQEFIDYLI